MLTGVASITGHTRITLDNHLCRIELRGGKKGYFPLPLKNYHAGYLESLYAIMPVFIIFRILGLDLFFLIVFWV